MMIPFVKPYLTGNEFGYINQLTRYCGDGRFTKECHVWLEKNLPCLKTLLTHSCTAALEMAALLIDIQPGDEIIMPSFTFVSTANAFVLRGGIPVFVDIRPDTLNINEQLIEAAITSKTKAIVPVHYAGVACEMDFILALAKKYNLIVIEDAAQGLMAEYKGRALGTLGQLGAFSFHETKNIMCGEGGALLINDPSYTELAEIIREKGTDRTRFYRGQVDKYTWQHVGSSYLPNELTAAFLFAQLEQSDLITQKRLSIWHAYHAKLSDLESEGIIRRPIIPPFCKHNAHIYYLLTNDFETRATLTRAFQKKNISAVFHYVPLHSSPAGKKYSRSEGSMEVTNSITDRLLRLPLFPDMDEGMVDTIVNIIQETVEVTTYGV